MSSARVPSAFRRHFPMLLAIALIGAAREADAESPSFDDLVDCRWAIEEVLWSHRIWPESNPGPKPPLAAVLSREVVERKMDDALRQATALEERFHSPIDAEVLRRELDRMAADSKDPATLRELFAAAGSGERAALCLALPSITRNRLAALYAEDPAIHRGLREQAELGLAHAAELEGLAQYGAEVEVMEIERARDDLAAAQGIGERGQLLLDGEAWRGQLASLARSFGGGSRPEPVLSPVPRVERASRLPLGRRSPLEETHELFRVREVRESGDDRLVLATAFWRKRPVDDWWAEARDTYGRVELTAEAVALPSVSAADCVDDTWSPTNDTPPPSPRYFHVAVWTGAEMLVWGGSIETVKYANGRRYDPATDSWSRLGLASTPPEPRHVATAVWTGTVMIVWGGYNTDYLGTGGRYNPATDTWTSTNPTGAPSPRVWHTAVWTGSEMIVWGGYDGSYLATGARYAPSTNTWGTLPLFPPSARAHHTAVWAGDRMIVWGGFNGSVYRNDGAEYVPGVNWIALPLANVPSERAHHTAVWTGNQMVVWGGTNGVSDLDTGGRYTPGAGGGWSATPMAVPPMLPARSLHRAVWAGAPTNRMIVWGGYDGGPLGDGALYEPASDTWTAMASAGAPEPRWGHSLVWTGSEAIVWGGGTTAPAGFYGSGGRYDPASNLWRATSVSEPPSARLNAAGVWTGSELLVWGGYDGSHLASGGLYSPASDSWWATSQGTDAPAASSRTETVWTGTEAILFGGTGSVQSRYAPTTDSWTPLPAAPVTAYRNFHTATWTGTEMIVLGGQSLDDFSVLEAGARFVPASNQWLPLPTGAGARAASTAVWTGNELLIWGAPDDPFSVADGMRYFPPLQSWTPMNTNGAPLSRRRHSAVWTGSEMIVWGGFDGQSYLASGGLYHPATDVWQPTAPEGAPSPRLSHSAVWTGSEMVVWGGEDSSMLVATGARYTPHMGWAATSTSGTAAPRRDHVTAWTGKEMLVWGGLGELGDPFSSGGRYCAYTPVIFRDGFESGNFFWWSGHP